MGTIVKRLFITLSVVLLALASTTPIASAETALPPLVISEIKVRNDPLGFNEYIEIYNPTANPTDLSQYYIEYASSPAPTTDMFKKFIIADGLLEPAHSLVLAKDNLSPMFENAVELPFSSMSDDGGTVRILDTSQQVVDSFSWTKTQSLAIGQIQYQCTLANTTCNANKSQSFNREIEDDKGDFIPDASWSLLEPSPASSLLLPIPAPVIIADDPPTNNVTDTPTDPTADVLEPDQPLPVDPITQPTPVLESSELLPVQITELLPNPAPPYTDSADEYVELYNPNTEPVDLTGYKLQTGNSFNYSYTFADTILGPGEYKSFMSSETGLVLSNTSGQARLLNSTAQIIDTTDQYNSADDGSAWALVGGAWQWTSLPTPSAANSLVLPVLKVASIKKPVTTKKATAKSATAKKATVKAAAAKKPAPKKAAIAASRQVYKDPGSTQVSPIHPSILAGVGVITLLYAIYEYRYDFQNLIRRLKRYRDFRREARQATPRG